MVLKRKVSIRVGKKGSLSDFEGGLDSEFHRLLIESSPGFIKDGRKKSRILSLPHAVAEKSSLFAIISSNSTSNSCLRCRDVIELNTTELSNNQMLAVQPPPVQRTQPLSAGFPVSFGLTLLSVAVIMLT